MSHLPQEKGAASLSSFFREPKMSLHLGPIFGSFCFGRPTAIFSPFCIVKWRKNGCRTLCGLGRTVLRPFFSILHCKMEKKWAAPGAPVLAAKITVHFFSILQCKMEKKWLQDPSRPWANRPAAIFSAFYTIKWRKNGPPRRAPFLAAKITAHFFSLFTV